MVLNAGFVLVSSGSLFERSAAVGLVVCSSFFFPNWPGVWKCLLIKYGIL